MAPRKKTGRSAAEAEYAALLKDNIALVGDVGEAWDDLDAALTQATALQKVYEDARAAAIKASAVTNDQLDQMGYKRAPKVPALPSRTGDAASAEKPPAPATTGTGRAEEHNGVASASQLASAGAASGEDQH